MSGFASRSNSQLDACQIRSGAEGSGATQVRWLAADLGAFLASSNVLYIHDCIDELVGLYRAGAKAGLGLGDSVHAMYCEYVQ